MTEVRYRGLKEWQKSYAKLQKRLDGKGGDDPILKAVHKQGQRLQAEVKKNWLTQGPVWVRTGRLRASIMTQTKRQHDTIRNMTGTKVFYGRLLEDGTKRMRPRPWLVPALDKMHDKIVKGIEREWRKLLRREK